MEKKTKNILYIAGAILLFLILLSAYFYSKGKKTTTIAPLPPDAAGVATASSSADVSKLSSDLYSDMKGISWLANHNEVPYQEALTLSDTDFVKLYNDYNTKYQSLDGRTLTAWINACSAIPFTPFDTVKTAMISRLGKLNLK